MTTAFSLIGVLLGGLALLSFVLWRTVKGGWAPSRRRAPRADRLFPYVLGSFGLFIVASALSGGDAQSGYSAGSQYFLGSRGGYTDVGPFWWYLSLAHSWVTTISVPALCLLGMLERAAGRPDP